jgi:hypothetical protein
MARKQRILPRERQLSLGRFFKAGIAASRNVPVALATIELNRAVFNRRYATGGFFRHLLQAINDLPKFSCRLRGRKFVALVIFLFWRGSFCFRFPPYPLQPTLRKELQL